MLEVTLAMVVIKVRFSLNEKLRLKRTLGSTAGITHFVFQIV